VLVAYLFKNPCLLIDLNRLPDATLKEQELGLSLLSLTAKHVHDPDILPFVTDIAESLKQLELAFGQSYTKLIASYLFEAGEVKNKDLFIKEFTKFLNAGDPIMTIAEQFRQEGFEKGKSLAEQFRLEGKLEGFEKGRSIAELETARKLLELGISEETILQATGVSLEALNKLKH
jgi:predicted transposase/invertase (TIGR01784 family)